MAYRTVSTEAILVVASIIPAHLMAREWALRYKERDRGTELNARRKETYARWQGEWESATNGSWTRRLIKNVEPWAKRKWGNLDFHLTQALTGHGCYNEYLHRFGKLEQPGCTSCGNSRDDAEHTIFFCDRW